MSLNPLDDLKHFVSEVMENKAIFAIANDQEVVTLPFDEEGFVEALCLFSTKGACEEFFKKGRWEGYEVTTFSVAEVIYNILPSLIETELMVGINWTSLHEAAAYEPDLLIEELSQAVDHAAFLELEEHLLKAGGVWLITNSDDERGYLWVDSRFSDEGALAVWTEKQLAEENLREARQEGELEDSSVVFLSAKEFGSLSKGRYIAINWPKENMVPEALWE